jgi:hypothetical protein
MKKLLLAAALFLGLAATAVAEPTYLPNFVTASDPSLPTTLFSLSNASDTARLVRANVYSKTGQLSAIFNVELPPRGTVSVNLRDTLNGETPICKGHFLVANLKGLVGEDGMARGYIAFEEVSGCTTLTPGETGYDGLLRDGAGIWGDWLLVDTTSEFAQGGELVKPATGLFEVRFGSKGKVVDGTELVIFAPSANGTKPLPILAWSEAGNPVPLSVNLVGQFKPRATNRIDLDASIGVNADFGRLQLDCREIPCYVVGILRSGIYDASLPAVKVGQ